METIEQAQNRLESLLMEGKNGFYRGVFGIYIVMWRYYYEI
jgi:hypothetical protein